MHTVYSTSIVPPAATVNLQEKIIENNVIIDVSLSRSHLDEFFMRWNYGHTRNASQYDGEREREREGGSVLIKLVGKFGQ